MVGSSGNSSTTTQQSVIQNSTTNNQTTETSNVSSVVEILPVYSGSLTADVILTGALNGEYRSNGAKGIVKKTAFECVSEDKRSHDYWLGSCNIGSTVTTYDLNNE